MFWIDLKSVFLKEISAFGYVAKVLLACFMALLVSLKFELDQPRTALMTVAIVMQSQSGMVFTKSVYRLLGTLVGVAVSFLLVAMFAQERVLFLLCMAIWIGVCTAGSVIFRHHQSYGFVLAGYTICIVGLPATINPELTFSIATTRISEIMIGLLCASLVSDLIFPQRISDIALSSVRKRYRDFTNLLANFSIKSLEYNLSVNKAENSAVIKFIGDIFDLESLNASSHLENDASRTYKFKFNALNNAFMEVSTTFHSLNQLLQRQHHTGKSFVYFVVLTLYEPLKISLFFEGRSPESEWEARQVSLQLKGYRESLPFLIEDLRQSYKAEFSTLEVSSLLDIETALELLQRFVDELYAYTASYVSLADEREKQNDMQTKSFNFKLDFDGVSAALAGLRGALSLALMAGLWIFLDWPSGVEAITIGVVTSTLFATSPSPTRTVKQFITGALIGTVFLYVCNFQLLPNAQGAPMLIMALTPGIATAAWLTTKPRFSTVGAGMFIIYLMHNGFNSGYSANPISFINDAIADVVAIMMSGVMYSLIDLTNSDWSRKRLSKALRRLVVIACEGPLALGRARLEKNARSLVHRLVKSNQVSTEQDKEVIDWLFSTLEIGHAVIGVREQLTSVDVSVVTQSVNVCLSDIAHVYELPSIDHLNQAVTHIAESILLLGDQSLLPQSTRHQLVTMLHFIRSVLLEERLTLSSYAPELRRT